MTDDAERKRSKNDLLREDGVLNSHPERVLDPKFQQNEFFDPHDLVQVKYEMLRRVSVENASVTDVAKDYGISRPTFYQAKANLEEAGLAGLVAKKRGPRGPRKLHDDVIRFLKQQVLPGQPIRARQLVALVRDRFGVQVHPRTIERALQEKKTVD